MKILMFSKNKFISVTYFGLLLFTSLFSIVQGSFFYLFDLTVFIEWEIFFVSGVAVVFTMLMDWMSVIFLGVVSLISCMVMLYSYSYMAEDKSFYRFISLVFLFVLSMVFMVMSPNMISILLGWDGLGLVSYGLVIYYQNIKSANAGMLTVLSNRVGDVGILISISWLFNYGSWDFFYLMAVSNILEFKYIMYLVLIAAMTSSAQLPFSAWLPAAMAAPTPVSALVHSSTLVTAGVYLLIRFNELLGISLILCLISSMTLFMSGLSANFEFDLKKIIALSTLSQLGMMMFTLSMGNYELAFFHLISHALFKSLLFLCAGFYIHSSVNSQDIRLMGSVFSAFPLVNVFFVGCSLSLCGFPFLAGFYSKDLILESYFFGEMWGVTFLLVFIGTMFTFTYSLRLVYYIYFGEMKVLSLMGSEEDKMMLIPMSILFLVSMVVGSGFAWVYLPPVLILLSLQVKLMIISMGILFSLLLFLLGSVNSQLLNKFSKSLKTNNLVWYLGGMWNLPFITPYYFPGLIFFGKSYLKFVDFGWLEFFGGQGIMTGVMRVSSIVDKWNYLEFKSYLFLIFFMLLSLIVLY